MKKILMLLCLAFLTMNLLATDTNTSTNSTKETKPSKSTPSTEKPSGKRA